MCSVLPPAFLPGLVEGMGAWYPRGLSTTGEMGYRGQEGESLAHPAQLALRKQGVEAWQPWRPEHARRRPHRSDADLPWQALNGRRLRGRDSTEEVSKMPTVRVVLNDGEEKIYHHAEAHIDTHNLLRIHRAEHSIAEFQSEYYQY